MLVVLVAEETNEAVREGEERKKSKYQQEGREEDRKRLSVINNMPFRHRRTTLFE